MGQLQFMPNIFYRYELTEMQTEGSISGTAYLTSFTLPQIFYRNPAGEATSDGAGEVMLPVGFDYSLTGTATRMPLERWQSLVLP